MACPSGVTGRNRSFLQVNKHWVETVRKCISVLSGPNPEQNTTESCGILKTNRLIMASMLMDYRCIKYCPQLGFIYFLYTWNIQALTHMAQASQDSTTDAWKKIMCDWTQNVAPWKSQISTTTTDMFASLFVYWFYIPPFPCKNLASICWNTRRPKLWLSKEFNAFHSFLPSSQTKILLFFFKLLNIAEQYYTDA